MKRVLPSFLKPFFWSYDLDRLDKNRDKKMIVTQILNYGTKTATDWLFSVYTKNEIADTLLHPMPGVWDKKSLNYWSLVFNVQPGSTARFPQP